MNYYENALKFEGSPYLSGGMDRNGIDCSGLVNAATGQKTRVWHTKAGTSPPGSWQLIETPKNDAFLSKVKMGDLFLWKGHCAFFAGGERLFHARKPGTLCGFTNDLKAYWLKEKGFPVVYRQNS
jgi:cell wall-associated NlpC family hydrolase